MEGYATDERRTRAFLSQVLALSHGIENKQQRIDALRDMATSTTSAVSDMPRADSPNLQRMETVVCKIADLEAEIRADQETMAAAKVDIANALVGLEDYREQRILFSRYVDCKGWSAIAMESGYSRRSVFRFHDAGIKHLTRMREGDGTNE